MAINFSLDQNIYLLQMMHFKVHPSYGLLFSYTVCITSFFRLEWRPTPNQNSIKSTIFWLLQLYFLIIVNVYGHGHNHLNHKYIHEVKPNIICKTFQIFHWDRNAKYIRWIYHSPSNLIIGKFELQNI